MGSRAIEILMWTLVIGTVAMIGVFLMLPWMMDGAPPVATAIE